MENWKKKAYKDNSGYSFLFVIFGVIFIAAIGVIALTMASNYYITTSVSKKSSAQFYSTESILQEIRTGLQEYANTTSEKAYTKALETYSVSTSAQRDKKYSIDFLNKLADSLIGTGITWDGTYNMVDLSTAEAEDELRSKLEDPSDYLKFKNNTGYVVDIDKIKALTTKPEAVDTTSVKIELYNDNKIKGINPKGEFRLVLKNLSVNYTDSAGYNSKIKTDIVVNVPKYHLSGDATINELKNYIVITDNKLNISNSGEHKTDMATLLRGNIYAGYLSGDDKSSIVVNNDMGGSQAQFFSDRIIARGDLNIKNGSDLTIRGREGSSTSDLWLLDIMLSKGSNSSKYTKLDSNSNAYIQNDLVVDDKNSRVKLSGSYHGYCFNKENTISTLPAELRSYYSSAILINGASTELDTSGLYSLILAGRAFIEKKRVGNTGNMENITSDIQMGESFSVKGNQVAYMVPEEYINQKMNPVIDGKKGTVDISALQASDIWQYLDSSEPVTENHYNTTMTYFFLKFKDEYNANQYFKKYYQDEDNKTILQDSAKTYITSWDAPSLHLDNSLYLLAGHIMRYYAQDGDSDLKETNYFNGSVSPRQNLLNDGIQKGKEFVSRQMSLLAASGTSEMRLEAESDKAPLVESKIIDFSKISGVISRSYENVGDIYFVDGDTSVSATTNKGIIVASGNVEVNADFTGLILAKGQVKVVGKVNAQNDIAMIKTILKNVEKDDEIRDIFYEIDKIDSAAVEKISMSDYVSYKNWSKNDDN